MTSQQLEQCVGIKNAFKLMNLWERAVQVTSGNRFTLQKLPSTTDMFKQLCYHNGIDSRHVYMYLKLKD